MGPITPGAPGGGTRSTVHVVALPHTAQTLPVWTLPYAEHAWSVHRRATLAIGYLRSRRRSDQGIRAASRRPAPGADGQRDADGCADDDQADQPPDPCRRAAGLVLDHVV